MFNSLPKRLAILTSGLTICTLLLSSGSGAKAQPGGNFKMRTTLPPYQPQGQWRPLDLNNISNLGFIQGTLGTGGLGGFGSGGIGGGIGGLGGGIGGLGGGIGGLGGGIG